ncbi:MAG: DUF2442 domain-containing protein [Sulfurovum sp.]|nr:DUF2442 domain-containing protein [Sulfurovum sp.]
MIKIVKASYVEGYVIELEFSDRKCVAYDFSYLLEKKGSLVQPLRQQEYFQAFFLELGLFVGKMD